MIDPILITGCARSGTSLIAGIVSICGAFGGDMSGPTRYNRKGMFENTIIRNSLVKQYLIGLHADRMGQNPLPNIEAVKETVPALKEQWRRRVTGVMIEHGYKQGPWFYKGAKMCLVWPIWHAAFPDAKWIIVRRRTEEIIRSCLRTGFMRGHRSAEGWQFWVDQHMIRFGEMMGSGLNLIQIWPETLIRGDLRPAQNMIRALGLTWRAIEVKDFVAPSLWRAGSFEPKTTEAT